MKANQLYLNILLTIISIALLLIIYQNQLILNRPVIIQNQAQSQPSAATQVKNQMQGRYAIVPVNADGSIDVRLKSSGETLDINISRISTSDELDINIDEIGNYSVSGELPIKNR
jgi:hypothetical protein